MPVCAQTVQLDGGVVALTVNHSTTDLSTCAFVLQTAAEYGSGNSIFFDQMSTADAQVIATHIGIVWAIAWSLKQIANLVRDLNPPERD